MVTSIRNLAGPARAKPARGRPDFDDASGPPTKENAEGFSECRREAGTTEQASMCLRKHRIFRNDMPVPLVTATATPKRLFTLAVVLRYASGTFHRTDRQVARDLAVPQRKRQRRQAPTHKLLAPQARFLRRHPHLREAPLSRLLVENGLGPVARRAVDVKYPLDRTGGSLGWTTLK
jgi:hypothetical protein